MRKSILNAIREGAWDYEPAEVSAGSYDATSALPGSAEKLAVLAGRAERGLPLWHLQDRCDYEEQAGARLPAAAERPAARALSRADAG